MQLGRLPVGVAWRPTPLRLALLKTCVLLALIAISVTTIVVVVRSEAHNQPPPAKFASLPQTEKNGRSSEEVEIREKTAQKALQEKNTESEEKGDLHGKKNQIDKKGDSQGKYDPIEEKDNLQESEQIEEKAEKLKENKELQKKCHVEDKLDEIEEGDLGEISPVSDSEAEMSEEAAFHRQIELVAKITVYFQKFANLISATMKLPETLPGRIPENANVEDFLPELKNVKIAAMAKFDPTTTITAIVAFFAEKSDFSDGFLAEKWGKLRELFANFAVFSDLVCRLDMIETKCSEGVFLELVALEYEIITFMRFQEGMMVFAKFLRMEYSPLDLYRDFLNHFCRLEPAFTPLQSSEEKLEICTATFSYIDDAFSDENVQNAFKDRIRPIHDELKEKVAEMEFVDEGCENPLFDISKRLLHRRCFELICAETIETCQYLLDFVKPAELQDFYETSSSIENFLKIRQLLPVDLHCNVTFWILRVKMMQILELVRRSHDSVLNLVGWLSVKYSPYVDLLQARRKLLRAEGEHVLMLQVAMQYSHWSPHLTKSQFLQFQTKSVPVADELILDLFEAIFDSSTYVMPLDSIDQAIAADLYNLSKIAKKFQPGQDDLRRFVFGLKQFNRLLEHFRILPISVQERLEDICTIVNKSRRELIQGS